MMLDVKRINGAADLEVRRLAGELAKLDATRLQFPVAQELQELVLLVSRLLFALIASRNEDMVAKQVNIVLDPVRAEVARAAQGQCRTEESCRIWPA